MKKFCTKLVFVAAATAIAIPAVALAAGRDDATEMRHGRGGDDRGVDRQRGRGADDAAEMRQGRGADDVKPEDNHARGNDDRPGDDHGRHGRGGDDPR